MSIYVTKPSLPNLDDVIPYFEEIWKTKQLSNCGPFHTKLEEALCDYLNVEEISLFSNGTLALLVALKSLNLSGEVITTPFSFIATSEAISWNGLKPVFADINPDTFSLDPESIEKCITPKTTAILPVHCYGLPCDIERIEEIAANYNLKVIYDAAHAFGVECHCGSLLNHGDMSILSFHATKVFNTFEGGAIICKDKKMKQSIDRLKNFGFVNETTIASNGINAKMSELHSVIGLAQLKIIDELLDQRKNISDLYDSLFSNIEEIRLPKRTAAKDNYSYYPITLDFEKTNCINEGDQTLREYIYNLLKENGIYSRRYFYPLISSFAHFKANQELTPNALKAANNVLCLPIYPGLTKKEIENISELIIDGIKVFKDQTSTAK